MKNREKGKKHTHDKFQEQDNVFGQQRKKKLKPVEKSKYRMKTYQRWNEEED